MTDDHRNRGFAISAIWVLVMVVPIVGIALWFAIDHANAQKDRATEQANARIEKKFRQALAISDAKHRQALHAQSVLFAYSINKSTCVLRTIAQQQISRLETTKTTGYKQAEVFWQQIIANQVPIPAGFNCASLPAKPPTSGGDS